MVVNFILYLARKVFRYETTKITWWRTRANHTENLVHRALKNDLIIQYTFLGKTFRLTRVISISLLRK